MYERYLSEKERINKELQVCIYLVYMLQIWLTGWWNRAREEGSQSHLTCGVTKSFVPSWLSPPTTSIAKDIWLNTLLHFGVLKVNTLAQTLGRHCFQYLRMLELHTRFACSCLFNFCCGSDLYFGRLVILLWTMHQITTRSWWNLRKPW